MRKSHNNVETSRLTSKAARDFLSLLVDRVKKEDESCIFF